MQNIGCKAQNHRKNHKSITLNQETALYFGTRLSFILNKQQTHQCPLGPVFMISSKKSGNEKVICNNIGCKDQIQ